MIRTPDTLLAELAELLRTFQGREYSGTIDRRTRFFDDLGFASIDAVFLGETLETRFGRKLPFHDFLAELSRRQAQDLELGELVDFLHRNLTTPSTEE